MRAPQEIATEIAATAKRMQALQAELIDARLAERDTICRLFCQGMHWNEIAELLGTTPAAVQGVLYRNGLTLKGRYRIAQQLDGNLRAQLRVNHGVPA